MGAPTLDALLSEIRACTFCAEHLPLGPRPILQAGASARLLIIGQAPGTRVHESGVPWHDASGDRLREWLGITPSDFYDPAIIALMPMGFCYPGAVKGAGDNPPRPECASLWHDRLRAQLPDVLLVLLVGSYAQAAYLPKKPKRTLTEAVQHWADAPDGMFPLPHSSWRSTGWMTKNSWFESDVLPSLQARVAAALSG
jgi:uracil-DNA glycosylase